jgi:histidine triad (HIT) family protein
MAKDCIFCKIIKKEVGKAEDIIYEDKRTIAFLDITPAQKKGGHTLVIPKKHYELVTDMSDEDAKAVMLTIKRLSKALLKFGEGMNIIQNNKKIAGQYVLHAHFHLIPRFEGDGVLIGKWATNKYSSELDRLKMVKRIKSLLKD